MTGRVIRVLAAFGALALAVIVLALLFGDDDTADRPTTKDDRFIAHLHDGGVMVERQDALVLAAVVCVTYDQHPDANIYEATRAVMKQRPDWLPAQAATFIGASVGAYCPEHRNALG